jgi:CDGSH-type Zn-finger protein
MSLKQCVCGRSLTYPYCDGTHKIKKEVDEKSINEENEKMV